MTSFGEAVAKARRPRNQQWLAEQMGVTQSAISDWERDRRFPRPESIPQLEQVLGLPTGYLLALRTGTDPETPAPTPRPPVAGFEMLTPDKQDAVISIVRAFLVEQGLDPDDPNPLNPDGTVNPQS